MGCATSIAELDDGCRGVLEGRRIPPDMNDLIAEAFRTHAYVQNPGQEDETFIVSGEKLYDVLEDVAVGSSAKLLTVESVWAFMSRFAPYHQLESGTTVTFKMRSGRSVAYDMGDGGQGPAQVFAESGAAEGNFRVKRHGKRLVFSCGSEDVWLLAGGEEVLEAVAAQYVERDGHTAATRVEVQVPENGDELEPLKKACNDNLLLLRSADGCLWHEQKAAPVTSRTFMMVSDGKELHKADELWSHFTLEGCQLDRFLWAHFTMAQVCDIVGDWWDSAHERVDLSTEYMQADVKLCFDGPLVNVCEEEEELDAPITRQQTTAAAAGEEEKTQADSE